MYENSFGYIIPCNLGGGGYDEMRARVLPGLGVR